MLDRGYSVERYGVLLGRLWVRWPYFYWRDLWVGVFVKERFWEMGRLQQPVYVCLIPTVVVYFEWTVRRGDR
jgi:hypothetical protein